MSLEKVAQCPICTGESFQPFLTCKDYTTTGELFPVEQCITCGMVLTNPRPTQETAGTYYQSTTYISHTSAASGIIDYIYLIFRRLTLRWKLSLINPYLQESLLLDVGCGTGHFLKHCKQAGVAIYGVEPSPEARIIATRHNLTVVEKLEKLPDIKFNVITLWHVLEHIYDLKGTIQELKSRLAENGIIFIAVPNWQSFDSAHYQALWAGYDVPRHVWHFSKTTMALLLKNAGLKIKDIIPMKLDAYYVSLLSEKYAVNGNLSLSHTINAIMLGYHSNRKGRREMNYSSLIYLVYK